MGNLLTRVCLSSEQLVLLCEYGVPAYVLMGEKVLCRCGLAVLADLFLDWSLGLVDVAGTGNGGLQAKRKTMLPRGGTISGCLPKETAKA